MSRWAGDLLGRFTASNARKRANPDAQDDAAFPVPRNRSRRQRVDQQTNPVIEVNTESEPEKPRRNPPPPKPMSKLNLANFKRESAHAGLRSENKRLTKDLLKMTSKAEKAQNDLVTELGKRCEGCTRVEADTGKLSRLISDNHAKLMEELGAIKGIVDVIRATPIEIVATQAAPQATMTPPIDSGTRSSNPHGMMTGMAPLVSMRASPSPTRELYHHHQTSPYERHPTYLQNGMQGTPHSWRSSPADAVIRQPSFDTYGEGENDCEFHDLGELII